MDDEDEPKPRGSVTPLVDGWRRYRSLIRTPMTIPGHKGRPERFLTSSPRELVRDDVPFDHGVDLQDHRRRLATSEALLAELWGADWARISVGGSTHGNQAFALAVGQPGDRVIVGRDLHRSVLLGLILAGLEPIWVEPAVDPRTGHSLGVPVSAVAAALAANPEVVAVFLVNPTYSGFLADIAGHAAVAHDWDVPLIVDQAWAAYLGFHPELPEHAIAAGADGMVTSAHKTLPAYTQAAFMVARTGLLNRARLDRAADATATTSPSGTIMASADSARAWLATSGPAQLGELLRVVRRAETMLNLIADVEVASGDHRDPLKLAVGLRGVDGVAVAADLARAGIPVELGETSMVIPIVTPADGDDEIDRLVGSMIAAVGFHRGAGSSRAPELAEPTGQNDPAAPELPLEPGMTPRDAFFADFEAVSLPGAVGRIAAEIVTPYPPGIPVLVPGEVVTAAQVAYLEGVRDRGVTIRYATDSTLTTLQVVRGSVGETP